MVVRQTPVIRESPREREDAVEVIAFARTPLKLSEGCGFDSCLGCVREGERTRRERASDDESARTDMGCFARARTVTRNWVFRKYINIY